MKYSHFDGPGYKDNKPKPREASWEEFCEILKRPRSSAEKTEFGMFLGGEAVNGRKKENVKSRTMATLDLENISGVKDWEVLEIIKGTFFDYTFIAHTTHRSTNDAPRIRVIFPLDPIIDDPDTIEGSYSATVAMLADMLPEKSWLDLASEKLAQCMVYPVRNPDGPEVQFAENDGNPVTPIEPITIETQAAANEKQAQAASAATNNKPRAIVAAFNKVYTIRDAIETYCAAQWLPGSTPNRYTHAGSTSQDGLAVLSDNMAYNFHASAPGSQRGMNAFDLVRLTLYGDKDSGIDLQQTPVDEIPSQAAMLELCHKDKRVMKQLKDDKKAAPVITRGADGIERDERGRIATTLNNIIKVIRADSNLEPHIRYNTFTNRPVAGAGLPWGKKAGEHNWMDVDTYRLRTYLEEQNGPGVRLRNDDVNAAIVTIAHDNEYNPVVEYIENLPKWDGKPRVDDILIRYLGAEDTEYTRMVTHKHMVAHIARAMNPGCKYDTMITLAGPQAIGKTSFITNLMPCPEWYLGNLPDFNKEGSRIIQGKWAVEMAELVAFRKSDKESFKRFLSQQQDTDRLPWDKFSTDMPRRCVFWGTTNEAQFLRDETGERRQWPVYCEGRDARKVQTDLPLEREQIWAEALYYYREGCPLYLSSEENDLLLAAQEPFKEVDPRLEELEDFLAQKVPDNWKDWTGSQKRAFFHRGKYSTMLPTLPHYDPNRMELRETITRREIWCECFDNEDHNPSRREGLEISNLMNTIPGWKYEAKTTRIYGYSNTNQSIRWRNKNK